MSMRSKHIQRYQQVCENYPAMARAAGVLAPPPADIIGRDIGELRRGLRNPEKANVVLLAEPGTGKTAYVQGFAYDPESVESYLVLDVNPERLIDKDGDRDNALLTGFNELLDQAGQYSKDQNVIVVLFVDEFHKMAEISPSLMESLKPRLEKSALHGFRLIAATTFQEYNDRIAKNRALDQRFLQIKLSELPKHAVISILENRAKQHGVEHLLETDVLNEIYVESKRILLSNAQPRASIDTLNSMIGDIVKCEYMQDGELVKDFYTPKEMGLATEKVLSRPLLKRIIKRSHGIDIDNEVNVTDVIQALKTRLYNQDNAIEIVVHQLEMAAQGFGELDRPKMSFISTGSTGTGKALLNSEWIPAPVAEGYVRNGDLKPGDYVYNRCGVPVPVTSIHPQGLRRVYRVTLTDGRQMDCARDHLWTYRDRFDNRPTAWKTATTEELMAKELTTKKKNGHLIYHFVLPQNEAVNREVKSYVLDPYALGVFLSVGIFTEDVFGINQTLVCPETMHQLGWLMDLQVKTDRKMNSWRFASQTKRNRWALLSEILYDLPELIGKEAEAVFIPECYKFGSFAQRWALVQGLFDINGFVKNNSHFDLVYKAKSETLVMDLQEVLWSLGIMSQIRKNTKNEYVLQVQVRNEEKQNFFRLSGKLTMAKRAFEEGQAYDKSYQTVAIKSIERLPSKAPMTCIMVDDEEHLYLAGKGHVVTHNTELAKIISETMRLPLKRFDMSRYSSPEDAGAFADDLFHAVWATPNAYLLIDEVEKSSKKAMNILLQVLDDARLTDSVNPDRVASFSGAIINLTTNLGSEVYQNMQKHQGSDAQADVELVYKSLAKSEVFETAVLGRLDAIVPFHPLPTEALAKIAKRMLHDIVEMAETPTRRIILSDDIIPYIVKDRTSNDTERGGARDAKRNVKNIVVQVLAHYLTYAKKEVPVLLYIKGRPRFKYKDIADPLNAQVALCECYPITTIDALLQKMSKKLGKPLQNKGIYLPANIPLDGYMKEIARQAMQGYYKFTSVVDGEKVYIKGV